MRGSATVRPGLWRQVFAPCDMSAESITQQADNFTRPSSNPLALLPPSVRRFYEESLLPLMRVKVVGLPLPLLIGILLLLGYNRRS